MSYKSRSRSKKENITSCVNFRIYFEALCRTEAAPAYDVDLGRAVANAEGLLRRATAAKCELGDLLRLTVLHPDSLPCVPCVLPKMTKRNLSFVSEAQQIGEFFIHTT